MLYETKKKTFDFFFILKIVFLFHENNLLK